MADRSRQDDRRPQAGAAQYSRANYGSAARSGAPTPRERQRAGSAHADVTRTGGSYAGHAGGAHAADAHTRVPAGSAERYASTGNRNGYASAGSQRGYAPTRAGASFGMPPQKKGKGPLRIVLTIAIIVLVVALIALGAILLSYWQGRHTYEGIADTAFVSPDDVAAMSLSDLEVNWETLRDINPDVVGWVYMPNTNINYPIVHRSDNDYYLTHDFTGSEGWLATFGCIFLSAENAADFSAKNNMVYGHNMNDGSMFSGIADLQEQDAFDQARTIYVLTPQGNYRLTTFALVNCSADDPLAQTRFENDEAYAAYLQDKADRSVVAVDDAVPILDMRKTFAFSTCDNLPTNGRLVLYSYVAESTVGDAGDAASSGDVPEALDPSVEEAVSEATSDVAA